MAATATPSLLDKLACLLADGTLSQTQYDDLSAQHTKEFDLAIISPTTVSSYITLSVNPAILRSTSAVLNTPELLEGILLHLDEQTLHTRVPLVCKEFQKATQSSIRIRRILFLSPDR